MANKDNQTLAVTSKAFQLWKEQEIKQGKPIPVDVLVEETGLAVSTLRRYLKSGGDVSRSSLHSVAVLANYFGVNIAEIIEVAPKSV